MHLICNENEYLLFDNSTVSMYKLTEEQGIELEKYSDRELDDLFKGIKRELSKSDEKLNLDECKKADRVILVVSQSCNMGCKYCYAQQGSYGEQDKCLMNIETLKKSLKKAVEIFPEGVNRIQFFGGEPLINFKLIKEAVPWILYYFEKKGLKKPDFTIVTNGTLITREIHEFFNEYDFNVTISIDGNKEVNDINRVFKNSSESTFDCINKNLEMMNVDRKYILMLEMTVDRENYIQYKNNGDSLIDIDRLLLFKPDLFHIVPAIWPKGHECCCENEDYFRIMQDYFVDIAKKARNNFGTDSPFNVMKIADMARGIIHKRKKNLLCGAGINQFSVDVNGDIYPCFAFIGKKDFYMGNVNEKDFKRYEVIRDICCQNTYDSIEACKNCWAKGLCSNCIGNSYLLYGRIDVPIKELCVVQRKTLEQTIISCYQMAEKTGAVV